MLHTHTRPQAFMSAQDSSNLVSAHDACLPRPCHHLACQGQPQHMPWPPLL
jgi:hypothetical protein